MKFWITGIVMAGYETPLTLSQFDFETDVDVNILGHILNISLGEIEIP